LQSRILIGRGSPRLDIQTGIIAAPIPQDWQLFYLVAQSTTSTEQQLSVAIN
jgi:hypothetical protein